MIQEQCRLAATSFDVKGVPSLHFAPLRMVAVHLSGGRNFQSVAISGRYLFWAQ